MAFPSPLYIQLRNLTYMTVTGAASVTLDDAGNVVEVYDLTTHRDLLDAGAIGRSWSSSGAGYVMPQISGTIPEAYDDRINHVVPRDTMKKRTMFIWWDGANGTGEKVAMCWADQFVGYSDSIPRFIQ